MTTRALPGSATLPHDAARRIVELACSAPSVHNTQPWLWRITGDAIELYADAARRLEVEDPSGRNQVISCGAALHHAEVVTHALGWAPEITRLPEGPSSALLASLRFDPARRVSTDPDALETVAARCTDRRRFTSWPVPPERLTHLADVALHRGTYAAAILDVTSRFRLELLVNRAMLVQAADPLVTAEQAVWTDRESADGVPSSVVPAMRSSDQPSRFTGGKLPDSPQDVESSDGIIVLGAPEDDLGAWLRAGEGLSALWLEATRGGLSVVPLSQPIEVEPTRDALRREVLGGLLTPHLVVRIGWQAISRGLLPHTPRRPVDDVLLD